MTEEPSKSFERSSSLRMSSLISKWSRYVLSGENGVGKPPCCASSWARKKQMKGI